MPNERKWDISGRGDSYVLIVIKSEANFKATST
jgi:hypothetical protein